MQDINDILRDHFRGENEIIKDELKEIEEDLCLLEIIRSLMARNHMNYISAFQLITRKEDHLFAREKSLKLQLEANNAKLREAGGYKDEDS